MTIVQILLGPLMVAVAVGAVLLIVRWENKSTH
jgi:hypothetical protein